MNLGRLTAWSTQRVLPLALLLLAGCAAAPPRDVIPPFRGGVIIADRQTAAAFADVNSFLRQQQVDRAVSQPTLSEDLFEAALAESDLAAWRRAFTLIDAYAEKLERLLDPELRAGVEQELAGLGEAITSQRPDQLPLGLAAAFTQLGGLLVQVHAEREAAAVIRRVDPAVQDLFAAMQEAIGDDATAGVRGTVWTAWTQELARIDVTEFRRANDAPGREAAARRYVAVLDERQAHDLQLDALRRALAQLGAAHRDLALGRRASAAAMIRLVQQEFESYEARLMELRDRRAAGGER